jgi:hypothetical protein
MARPVTETPAIEIVEEAIHVLRGAGARALALIWTGAIPFALGVLLFWRDITHYSRNAKLCAWESLLLVILLLWMNVWRGIFATAIHAQLTGWSPTRNAGWVRLAGIHLLLGNSKLVLMPLAASALLPLPGAVAFFRMATAVAAVDREDLWKTVAKARKLSPVAQPVLLLLLLAFIGTLLFVNIVVLLALLPQLTRILTGYESSFTRAGVRLLADPSFYVAAGLMTWLAFEPLAQTVYTVAMFHAESKESGDDVRARFRALLRSGGIAALLLVLCAPAVTARPALDPSQLDRSVQQTLASPQYGWNIHQEQKQKEAWFVRFTDSLGASLSGVKAAIGRGIDYLRDWIRRMFETPTPQGQGPPAGGAIRGELYLALVLALLAAIFMIWRGRAALARRQVAISAPPQTISLAADNVTADQLPDQGWYLLADECFSNAQFRLGLRALYLANLAGMAQEGWIAIHSGKTDHEYESELRRRARGFPDACQLFSVNIALFERVWYGNYPISFEDCQAFRDRAELMKHQMKSEMAGVSA